MMLQSRGRFASLAEEPSHHKPATPFRKRGFMSAPAWTRYLRPQLDALGVYDVPPAEADARLGANECPEPWPSEVMAALGEIVQAIELGRYPDTSGRELRAILAARHDCSPDRVVLGNGSCEIINLLFTALSGRADAAIVIPRATFIMYAHSARIFGMAVNEVELGDAFQLDEAKMRAALSAPNAAMCFIARPNNPTSSLFDAELLDRLIEDYPATLFVIDEAYAAYAPGCSMWRPDRPSNFVLISTLSKVGLAALRIGYAIAPPSLALALNKVRSPYNVSQTSLAIAVAVATRFADVQAEMIARAIENRGRLIKILSKIPGSTTHPSFANMVLVHLRDDDEATRITSRLAEKKILVKKMSPLWGLSGCIRASVGTSRELDALDAALTDVLTSLAQEARCP